MTLPRRVRSLVESSGTSFYWAMRFLPRPRREAMYAVYAYCRVLDDIADGDTATADREATLAAWRDAVRPGGRGPAGVPDADRPVAEALEAAVAHWDLPRAELIALIDGMEMDARGPLVAPPLATLEQYCRRVAGAVGLLAVRILGCPEGRADSFAVALGEAFQLTNILRDVAEDARLGRLYLPREVITEAGLPADPAAVPGHPNLGAARAAVADLAEARYRKAVNTLPADCHRPLWAARVMMALYHHLLARMAMRGWDRADPPLRLGRGEKLAVAVSALVRRS